MKPRHYPDIRCERCRKWTPAGGANAKWCPECKKIKKREQNQAGNKRWNKIHGNAYPPLEHRDSVEHYIRGTTWSYHHDGICWKCKKEKRLNRSSTCLECYRMISDDMTGPDDVYEPDPGRISEMALMPSLV